MAFVLVVAFLLVSRKNALRRAAGSNISHPLVGVRGSPERDISSLGALGPGGGQISSVVLVSTRADGGWGCGGVLKVEILFFCTF